MYLARIFVENSVHYVLRESISDGDYLTSRDLINLGPTPEQFILYPGGSSFYLDPWVFDQLQEKGLAIDDEELEEFFFPFLDPYIRSRVDRFHHRHKNRRWRPMDRDTRTRAIKQTHVFDRRRLHFLRFGQSDQRQLDRSPSLFKPLLDKSRDELEQLMLLREQELKPHEYKRYIFTVFDLQQFFTESYARTMPDALNEAQLDAFFLKEFCRLDQDRTFWKGMPRSGCLSPYLVRYLVMFFDFSFPGGRQWDDYLRSFIDSRRRYRAAKNSPRMSVDEASTVFGVTRKELAGMDRKELIRVYRKKAHELHPDKGGDSGRFIELTAAYNELLRTRP